MKINIIRIILLILLLATFYLIFGFSNQNSEQSSGISRNVSKFIINIINKNESKEIKENKIKTIEPIIRKIAHYTIYTIVGLLLMSLLFTYKIKLLDKYFYSQCIGILYALSDEIHQSFIPGRSAQFSDVLLDSFGVLTGILIVYFISRRIIKQKS